MKILYRRNLILGVLFNIRWARYGADIEGESIGAILLTSVNQFKPPGQVLDKAEASLALGGAADALTSGRVLESSKALFSCHDPIANLLLWYYLSITSINLSYLTSMGELELWSSKRNSLTHYSTMDDSRLSCRRKMQSSAILETLAAENRLNACPQWHQDGKQLSYQGFDHKRYPQHMI